jgi:hypothetical protein
MCAGRGAGQLRGCGAALGAGRHGIVTGRVIDSASQQPLVSATIRVVGTTSGALTRNDGSYTLSGSARPAALRVTRIGFAAQTRPVTVDRRRDGHRRLRDGRAGEPAERGRRHRLRRPARESITDPFRPSAQTRPTSA